MKRSSNPSSPAISNRGKTVVKATTKSRRKRKKMLPVINRLLVKFGLTINRINSPNQKFKSGDTVNNFGSLPLEFKTQAQKFIDKNIYKDQSPLSLTDLGKALVTDSGFTEIFEQVRDNLVEMLEEMQPSNQYETQEKARALMDSLADYRPFRPIQQYAFDHGKDLNQILRAGAIMLRDYYFEKHPEVVDPKEDW